MSYWNLFLFPHRSYLGREGENTILERVQLARAQYSHVSRLAAAQSEFLVAAQVSVQVAQHAGRLHLNWRHLSNRLHVQIVFSEFIANVVVFSQNNHLYDNIGFLLRTQSPIQRIQFTDSEETLKIKPK